MLNQLNLPNLIGYIRLSGYPLAKVKIKYPVLAVKAPAFVDQGRTQEYVVGNFNGVLQDYLTDTPASSNEQEKKPKPQKSDGEKIDSNKNKPKIGQDVLEDYEL